MNSVRSFNEKLKLITYLTLFSAHFKMECRLVLNNRANAEISNEDMNGRFHQLLKYFKYRRVPSKNGKAVFYLFFRKEEETYAALRAANSIKEISLVRYCPCKPIETEPVFRPFPPQKIIDICRYAFRNRLANFENVVWNVIFPLILIYISSHVGFF